ncbi:acyl-CoA dehydrogenase family protein [Chloroflexota bacterium]
MICIVSGSVTNVKPRIGRRGWFGALIPEECGGRVKDWGVTEACIIIKEVSRAGEVYSPFTSTIIDSATQLVHDGNAERFPGRKQQIISALPPFRAPIVSPGLVTPRGTMDLLVHPGVKPGTSVL